MSNKIIHALSKNEPLSEEVAEKIIVFFPSISKEWLISGTGEAPTVPIPTIYSNYVNTEPT